MCEGAGWRYSGGDSAWRGVVWMSPGVMGEPIAHQIAKKNIGKDVNLGSIFQECSLNSPETLRIWA